MKILTDANLIVANISHKLTEYAAIYPITPSSTMGEEYAKLCDKKIPNIFNSVPKTDVMQSETGAISSASGALFGGSYSTTFTSSQGLLLMIPNMYKMASSLKPFVLNVASRSLSTHALNIFCDHSDIYSAVNTGFSMLCSSNTQKAQDFCMISHMLTLKSKIPVLHFFDGFITSHKNSVIEKLTDDQIKNLFPYSEFYNFKNSILSPSTPKTLGTNQNPDIYYQNREAIEKYYKMVPKFLNDCFEEFYKETGRKYSIFEYFGSKNATKIVVSMGSSVETLKSCLKYLPKDYGVIGVNLLSPFVKTEFLKVIPTSCKVLTVLDRSKMGGNLGVLAKNVIACLQEKNIKILCGTYGLGGKEFNLNHASSVFENMSTNMKNNFNVGIIDNENHSSLPLDKSTFDDEIKKICFYGVGNDGSVSASKMYAKLIFNSFNKYVCENSYYDSKKSGNLTESQVFESESNFEINYKETHFDHISISNLELLNSYDLLKSIKQNCVVLVNSDENLLENLSDYSKYELASNNCKVYFVPATKLAKEYNLGNKINLIMLAAFINISCDKNKDILIENLIKESGQKFNNNFGYLKDVKNYVNLFTMPPNLKSKKIEDKFLDNNNLPVSFFKANGEFENVNTFSSFCKDLAVWQENKCIKCTNCAQICPHNAIKIKKVRTEDLKNAPTSFKYIDNKNGTSFCLLIDPSLCTGCGNCTQICPSKALILSNFKDNNKEYFLSLKGEKINNLISDENYYSCNSSCTGCMEIMYYKLLGFLFGSKLNIINATGCSSIYNGGINCSPFKLDKNKFGTSFISNLFEDNAEFGYGLTTGFENARNNFIEKIKENINDFSEIYKENLTKFLNNIDNFDECQNIYRTLLNETPRNEIEKYANLNLKFILPNVNFIVGGDGWAYDIDFGGLDQVISMNKNVNILILDNEVYSNTGGQTSKATNIGAKTKYTSEKQTLKKDLFLSLFQYKNINFYKVDFSANRNQCIKAFKEAVNHNGPSVIVAYTPCINHKIDMKNSFAISQNAVKSGYFNLISYENGKLTLDSTPDFSLLENFILNEGRYKDISKETLNKLIESKKEEYEFYKKLSSILN